MIPDYYKLLGVGRNDSLWTIKKRFRELSKVHHPDVGGDVEVFQKISEAYTVLANSEKRRRYNETLMLNEKPRPKRGYFRDVFFDVYVTLKEGIFGCIKTVEFEKSFIDVRIKGGVQNGETIVMRNYNQSGMNVAATIHIVLDKGYEFEKYKGETVLVYNVKTTSDLLGKNIKLPLVDGNKTFYLPKDLKSGNIIKLKDLGYTKNGKRDELFVRVRYNK